MPVYDAIQLSFSAGIIAPSFQGRSDLDFYRRGLYDAENFFVDARGGINSRPGTKFIAGLTEFGPRRLRRFRVNSDSDGSDFLLVFGWRPTIENPRGVCTVTIFKDGKVVAVITDCPYTGDQLPQLHFHQWQRELVVCHNAHEPSVLTYHEDGSWSFARAELDGNTRYPAEITTAVPTPDPEGVGAVYGVSSINEEQVESPIGAYAVLRDIPYDPSGAFGPIILSWEAVPGSIAYRVYRSSVVPVGADTTLSIPLGLVAEVEERAFVDLGIEPIFEEPPSRVNNPFRRGAVTRVDITKGGSGYPAAGSGGSASNINGTGFFAVPVVDGTGVVIGDRVISQGRDYTTGDKVIFPGSTTGDQAEGEITAQPTEGIFPRASARFQQRRLFAGTTRKPMTVWGSRIAAPDVFWCPLIPSAIDAFEVSLESEELNPIKYLTPSLGGLLAFTGENVFRLWGQEAFSAELSSEPLQFDGAADVEPLRVHGHVLYVEQGSQGVRDITPGQNAPGTYSSVDRSLLSNHLFTADNPITSWAFARVPFGVIWAVREDGSMLSFTYHEELATYAWSRHKTAGKFLAVEVIQEGNEDRVYFLVERGPKGNKRIYLEAMSNVIADKVEDCWSLDCAVERKPTFENPLERVAVGDIAHLEGLGPIEVLADGAATSTDLTGLSTTREVDGAEVTKVGAVERVLIGLPADGYIETLPVKTLELPTGHINISDAEIVNMKGVTIAVRASFGMGAVPAEDADELAVHLEPIGDERDPTASRKPPFHSRTFTANFVSPKYGDAKRIRLYKTGPHQVNIEGTVLHVEADPNALPVNIIPARQGGTA